MLFDYLSDWHFDKYNIDIIPLVLSEQNSDALIIAGDIGERINENIEKIKILAQSYTIFMVLGNHDYYIKFPKRDDYKDSFKYVEECRERYNAINNVYCLNGNVVHYNGIKIGGADGWYDTSYIQHFPQKTLSYIYGLWRHSITDSSYLFIENEKVKNYYKFFEKEYKKIKDASQTSNIIITHIKPLIQIEHQDIIFQNDEITTFYCFDGSEFLKRDNIKKWIHGHNHKFQRYLVNDVEVLCNPLGYQRESSSKYQLLRSFELTI